MVDGVTEGEVRCGGGKRKGFFINMTTVLRLSGRVGHSAHTFSVCVGQSLHSSRVQKRAEWKDRRIIPVHYFNTWLQTHVETVFFPATLVCWPSLRLRPSLLKKGTNSSKQSIQAIRNRQALDN